MRTARLRSPDVHVRTLRRITTNHTHRFVDSETEKLHIGERKKLSFRSLLKKICAGIDFVVMGESPTANAKSDERRYLIAPLELDSSAVFVMRTL